MQVLAQNKFLIFLIAIILIILLVMPSFISKLKFPAYKIIRSLSKYHLALVTKEYKTLTDQNFIVKYKSINKESAQLVLENANEIMGQVNQILDYTNGQKIPVIIYSSMEELNESFGWDGDRSPMGVYWMGSIRILAPEAWLPVDEDQALIFKNTGPMAHEYAHLVVDYKTSSNYTRWFTEGVAQYVEREITGFSLEEPKEEAKRNLYSFNDLNLTFDDQENQELAYWQSLLAIDYLVEKQGEQIINQMLAKLNTGLSFDKVFLESIGEEVPVFEKNLRDFARNH